MLKRRFTLKNSILLFTLLVLLAAVFNVTIASAAPVPGTNYTLKAVHSGKCLDVQAPNTADGSSVDQWACNGNSWQTWSLQDAGGGYYRIISQNSSKCLDVNGASTANGAQIIQWGCGTGTNQQWQLVATGSDYQLRARHSGKCADVTSASTADGALVKQYTCGSGNNQKWTFTALGAGPTPTRTRTPTGGPITTPTRTLGASPTRTPTPTPLAGWNLVWSDEFNGPGIDTSNWGYELGYVRNNEQQYYTNRPENARIENGNLVIEARRENFNGYAYTSASLLTQGKRQFQYGRFELRAIIPTPSGSWPAWWTLGIANPWPRNGEIDIMEFYRGMILANVAYQNSGGSIVWDSITKNISDYGAGWSSNYHIWVMEWDTNTVNLYVDGVLLNTFNVNNATVGSYNPFRQPHYMLVNLAIGGNNGGNPASTTFPLKYYVDYVRVYQR